MVISFETKNCLMLKACVGKSIAVMQNPGFSCPGSSSFSTDFVDKTSQDFLVEKLVNCLP